MPKFRVKAAVIEAAQYVEGAELPKGLCVDKICHYWVSDLPHVHTIHQGEIAHVMDGDWILPEPDGIHFYPCKPDIFEDTYEAVDD